jgi:hypothetical protein
LLFRGTGVLRQLILDGIEVLASWAFILRLCIPNDFTASLAGSVRGIWVSPLVDVAAAEVGVVDEAHAGLGEDIWRSSDIWVRNG